MAVNWPKHKIRLQLLNIWDFRYQNGIVMLFESLQPALLCGILECGDYSHSFPTGLFFVLFVDLVLFIRRKKPVLTILSALYIFLRSK